MGRKIRTLYMVHGTLHAVTPIHVGGLDGGNPESDMPLAVDGQERFYIPGTSLAGALRQWCEVNLGCDMTKHLWGFAKEKDNTGDAKTKKAACASVASRFAKDNTRDASLFTVDDAVIKPAISREIRDGVCINRETGTAADKGKYDLSIFPRGTIIDFSCSLAVIGESDEARSAAALSSLLRALEEGRIRLGAQRTRGMGRVKLENFNITKASLDTKEGILSHLRGKDTVITLADLTQTGSSWKPQPQAAGSVMVRIDWQPTEPLMVKSGIDGIAVDGLPLMGEVGDGKVAQVIPGSSLKGVLRSRAELITETLKNSAAVSDAARLGELTTWMFGSAKNPQPQNQQDKLAGMGMLSVDDCYANTQVDQTKWQTVVTSITDDEVKNALGKADLTGQMENAYHVAIDRWTGGASKQKLFNQLEPHGMQWQPFELTLDFSRIERSIKNEQDRERTEQQLLKNEQDGKRTEQQLLALLLLILRDMAAGRLPVGYGTNRGMGGIAVDKITLTPDKVSWLPQQEICLEHGDMHGLDEELLKKLDAAWRQAACQAGGA